MSAVFFKSFESRDTVILGGSRNFYFKISPGCTFDNFSVLIFFIDNQLLGPRLRLLCPK